MPERVESERAYTNVPNRRESSHPSSGAHIQFKSDKRKVGVSRILPQARRIPVKCPSWLRYYFSVSGKSTPQTDFRRKVGIILWESMPRVMAAGIDPFQRPPLSFLLAHHHEQSSGAY